MSAVFYSFSTDSPCQPPLMAAEFFPVLGHAQLSHLVVRVETRLAYLVSRILELLTSMPRMTTLGTMLRCFTVRWFVAQRYGHNT